jgi:hypothetical protein
MAEIDLKSGAGARVAYLSDCVWSSGRSSTSTRAQRWPPAERRIAFTDCALHVVSDFILEQPVTVAENRPIDEALREMMLARVRAMFVVQSEVVTGLVTSYDIQGERPLQFLRTSNFSRHDEIEVAHIMTPWERVPTLDWQVVCAARVEDIERLFERTRATHLVLVKTRVQRGAIVRGLISRARLERQLGRSIEH